MGLEKMLLILLVAVLLLLWFSGCVHTGGSGSLEDIAGV